MSLKKRMDAGGSVVAKAPASSKAGSFFFSLKFKGDPIPVSDHAKEVTAP